MGSLSNCKCLPFVSMNLRTLPTAMVVSLSSDKCAYCKSLWIKALKALNALNVNVNVNDQHGHSNLI
jgi:hypothetical protein